jgi:putative oxidoreductase
MRHVGVLFARVVLGGYLFVHGAKKLLGWFDGPGLGSTAKGFEAMGIRPGKPAAVLAGSSQMLGGALTATGVADPLGPMIIAGNMAVAGYALRGKGLMAQDGGSELPLADLALAVALLSAGPGVLRLGPRLSRSRKWTVLVASVTLVALVLRRMTSGGEVTSPVDGAETAGATP